MDISPSARGRSRRLGGARGPVRHGGRARPRQPRVHRAVVEPDQRTSPAPGAQARPVAGASVPPGVSRLRVLGRAAEGTRSRRCSGTRSPCATCCCWRAGCSWSGRRRRRSTTRSIRTARPTKPKTGAPLSLTAGLIQIIVIDIVFSVDSIITAVGMTDHFPIMVIGRRRRDRGDDRGLRAACRRSSTAIRRS